ncbi:helix-turn-helix domain-containing protein [Flavobacterium aciduliphilum]|uniref:HTH domain-containing protein n=1 Tax=Flavobacterium aciduliphilum TaxID=1101402 RepID=A0A328YLT6_9FLAO|nr:HTH domain-containing protein [Flavobacterium aciduliphilum]RAR73795.1 HTH domain-containing protein [Flavobacterium aciduliphilum]
MDVRIIIRLDHLIINEMTGSPKQLASKLGITERSVYNYISFMKKEMNAPIKYDYQIQSYIYYDDWEFKLSNSK